MGLPTDAPGVERGYAGFDPPTVCKCVCAFVACGRETPLMSPRGVAAVVARRRVATERDFADRVVFWQERLTAMTDGIDPVSPPARVKKKLMAQVFPKQRVSILQRLWLWL